ncbi:MAG: hypothetical protein ABSF35_20990 [Polyangia bacterium]|jgi:hypothetical protein
MEKIENSAAPSTKRRRRPRAAWIKEVRSLHDSGLSPEEYAAKKGMGLSTLKFWMRVLRNEVEARPKSAVPVFLPVSVLQAVGRSCEGGTTGTLYSCNAGTLTVSQVCSNGCTYMASGQNDVCAAPAPTCPNGNGLYVLRRPRRRWRHPLLVQRRQHLTVSQVCSNGCTYMASGQNDVCKTAAPLAPGAPTLVSPSNGATGVTVNAPTLTWAAPFTGTPPLAYDRQLAADSGFTNVIGGGTSLSTTTWNVGQILAYGQPFFWRVRASNATGTGPWSTTFSFTGTCASISWTTPLTGSHNSNTSTVTFTWQPASGATAYVLGEACGNSTPTATTNPHSAAGSPVTFTPSCAHGGVYAVFAVNSCGQPGGAGGQMVVT